MTDHVQNGLCGKSEMGIEFAQFLHTVSSMKEPNIQLICDRLEHEIRTHDPERRLRCAELLSSEASHCIPAQVRDWAMHELLFTAAFCSDFRVMDILLGVGIDINAYDIRTNLTTLALASVDEDEEFIKYLLKQGADPFIRLNGKDAVLETYMHSGKTSTIQLMLEHCPNICTRLLEQPEIFDSCILVGKPENISVLLEQFQMQGIEVSLNPDILLGLAYEEDAENLRKLIDIGFTFNVFDDSTIKACFYAIKAGNKEIVELFLEQGMITSSDYKGNQPIHYAIKYDRLDIVKMLFRYGVQINAFNAEQEHPLILAAQTGNHELFGFIMDMEPRLDTVDLDELLVEMNMKMKIYHPELIDMRDALTDPPIAQKGSDEKHVCCISSLIEGKSNEECIALIKESLSKEYVPNQLIAKIISERSIDINQLINNKESLLHFAAKNNLPYAIKLLLTLGADINIKCACHGRTPLLTAIEHRNKEACLILIESGADCEMADDLAFTPVMEAVHVFGPDHRVVIALLRTGAHDHGLIFISDN